MLGLSDGVKSHFQSTTAFSIKVFHGKPAAKFQNSPSKCQAKADLEHVYSIYACVCVNEGETEKVEGKNTEENREKAAVVPFS